MNSLEFSKSSVYGDMDYDSVMVGQITAVVKKKLSCTEIITEMFAEAEQLLSRDWR